MPARLLLEWMAYYQIEPWGEERADLRMQVLATEIRNFRLGFAKGARPAKLADFRFDFAPRRMRREQPVSEIKARLLAMFPPRPKKRER